MDLCPKELLWNIYLYLPYEFLEQFNLDTYFWKYKLFMDYGITHPEPEIKWLKKTIKFLFVKIEETENVQLQREWQELTQAQNKGEDVTDRKFALCDKIAILRLQYMDQMVLYNNFLAAKSQYKYWITLDGMANLAKGDLLGIGDLSQVGIPLPTEIFFMDDQLEKGNVMGHCPDGLLLSELPPNFVKFIEKNNWDLATVKKKYHLPFKIYSE